MQNTIWKYPLEIKDINSIEMPEGSKLLCVQLQNGAPCLWALVDSHTETKEVRLIETIGTGHNLTSDPREYIGSYQLHNGALVFHVFEQIAKW